MSGERAAAWLYRGLWAGLVRWFRVPADPPSLPASAGDRIDSFRPAPGFLRYLKLWFWLGLLGLDAVFLAAWIASFFVRLWLGIALTPLFLAVAILPDILAYVAIHLRYDTTWYVLGQRSLRIRRGIWVLRETTITFENVQNVKIQQGPLQRHYGIADVVVETAGGGGGGGAEKGHKGGGSDAHVGRIEGVADAERIRDLVLARVRRSRTAGLGDEEHGSALSWSPEHLSVLRQIRDAAAALAER